MGSDAIALPLLNQLWEFQQSGFIKICALFTQPDRPSGRGMKLQSNALKDWANEKGILVFQPPKPNKQTLDFLRNQRIDLVLVMAYGNILRQTLLDAPRLGCLNFHASLLPMLRGACPINAAVAEGLKETGVSLMRCVRRLDAGPVTDSELIQLAPDEDALSLYAKTAEACVPLLSRNLSAILAGTARFVEQDERRATFTRILHKDDAALDFHLPATTLERRIRALRPWPGSRLRLSGNPQITLKVGAASIAQAPANLTPGDLCLSQEGLLLICSQDALRLDNVQRPGGKMLPTKEFLRGFKLPCETRAIREISQPLIIN